MTMPLSLEYLRQLSVLRAPPGKPFTLKSGKESQVQVDIRRAALDPYALRQLSLDLFWKLMSFRSGATLVAGVVLGGCPLATGISLASLDEAEFRDNQGDLVHPGLSVIRALMVRTEPGDHGSSSGKLVEGIFEPGEWVILVEDVVTTGISSTKAIEALQAAGLQVSGIVAVLDREEGGQEAFEALGIPFKALYTLQELVALSR